MTSTNEHRQDAALPDGDPRPDPIRISTGGVWLRLFAFLLGLEVATGVLMMTVYSPSTTTAWASVWYIQTRMDFGWLIRGVHRFSSDAMLIVAAAYLLHLLVRKSYCSPRYHGWWIGLCLIGIEERLAGGALLVADNVGVGAAGMADYLELVRSRFESRTEWFDIDLPWGRRDALEITVYRP